MSIIIDRLVQMESEPKACYDGYWYAAKPMEIFSIKERIKDAWRVLVGKSRAYHYKADEVGKN